VKRILFPAIIILFYLILATGTLIGQSTSDGKNGNCTCHGGAGATTTITLDGFPESNYILGESYQVTVSVSDSSLQSNEGGIWIAVDQGTLTTNDANLKLESGDLVQTNEVSGVLATSWVFNWTAPDNAVAVNLDAVAMVADGDGALSGDFWGILSLTIYAEGETAPPPPDYEEDIIVAAVLATILLVGLTALLIFVDRFRRRN
jgi:hypothetical protein